jgi:hypothetical protein
MFVLESFRKNPHTTLMDIFLDQTSERVNAWIDNPQWFITKLPKSLLLAAKDITVEIAEDIAAALRWIGDGIETPRKAGEDIKDYWNEIKTGIKTVIVMWKEDHRKALSNFFGGLLFFVSNHPVEFGVQLGLLLASGGYVFHQIGEGAELAFKAFGLIEEGTETGLKSALVNSLWFLHSIDDPLAMLPALLAPVNQGVSVLDEARNVDSDSENTANDTLNSLQLPEEEEMRNLAFGSTKSYNKMNGPERVEAFKNFQKFVCAHSNGTLIIPPEAIPEAKLTENAAIHYKCHKLSL